MTVHALFFCLRPDASNARRLGELSTHLMAQLGLTPRPARTERLHITLHHLGWFDDQTEEGRAQMTTTVALAMQAGGRLRASPFAVDFDTVLSFTRKPSNRPWLLTGAKGLDAVRVLQAQLMTHLGLPPQPFTPHLTLGYDDQAVAPEPCVTPGWWAADVHLMDSLQGESRHVPLAQWMLRPI